MNPIAIVALVSLGLGCGGKPSQPAPTAPTAESDSGAPAVAPDAALATDDVALATTEPTAADSAAPAPAAPMPEDVRAALAAVKAELGAKPLRIFASPTLVAVHVLAGDPPREALELFSLEAGKVTRHVVIAGRSREIAFDNDEPDATAVPSGEAEVMWGPGRDDALDTVKGLYADEQVFSPGDDVTVFGAYVLARSSLRVAPPVPEGAPEKPPIMVRDLRAELVLLNSEGVVAKSWGFGVQATGVENVVFSPDGRRVGFSLVFGHDIYLPPARAPQASDAFVADVDGSHAVRLTRTRLAKFGGFTPDGLGAFVENEEAIMRVALDGTGMRTIIRATHPSVPMGEYDYEACGFAELSPDGAWLVAACSSGGYGDTYRIADVKAGVEVWSASPGGYATFVWKAKSVAMMVKGMEEDAPPTAVEIAYSKLAKGLATAVAAPAYRATQAVGLPAGAIDAIDGVTSPDGKRSAFVAIYPHAPFLESDAFGSGGELFVADADGDHRTSLSRTAEHPVWSPSGAELAWTESGAIVVASADGTKQERLAVPPHPDTSPDAASPPSFSSVVWSPDGAFLAALTEGESAEYVAVARADGRIAARGVACISPEPPVVAFDKRGLSVGNDCADEPKPKHVSWDVLRGTKAP